MEPFAGFFLQCSTPKESPEGDSMFPRDLIDQKADAFLFVPNKTLFLNDISGEEPF